MADFKKMNTKTAMKHVRELGIPIPEDATRETLIKLLEAHAAGITDEVKTPDEWVEAPLAEPVTVPAGADVVLGYDPATGEGSVEVIPGQVDLEAAIDEVTGEKETLVFENPEMHIDCKNCGRDLVAIHDWHVMTPPGFVGEPNEEFIRNHSYCSGCAVAVNTQLRGEWTVTQVVWES